MLEVPDFLAQAIHEAPFAKVAKLWAEFEEEFGDDGRHWLGINDRYYLLVRLLKRLDCVHPWLYSRCREVERDTDGYLDLWAREHYKSTIITFAGCIQEILRDPEITIGIFSHTKPVAKAFLKQIKTEFESNELLKTLYSDILWQNPEKDSPGWSIDTGIIVKRKTNPKECTLEAHGLVDGQPTSRHFRLMVYDDVVTDASVSTPEQIQKTTAAWELSDNLGASNLGIVRKWHIGTRYSYADTYEDIMGRGVVIPRLYPATDTGQIDGSPVFLKKEVWEAKVRAQGEATISCQMLQNPLAGKQKMFNVEDLRTYEVRPETMNIYIMVDPARSKKRGSAKTAITVVGVDYAMNKYLLDGFNHRMDLRERWERTAQMYHRWKRAPGVQYVYVGYEAFGAQADMDYFEEQMKRPDQGGRFPILELEWPREGDGSKVDRVQRLGPDLRGHRIFLPYDTDDRRLTSTQIKMKQAGLEYRIARPIRRKDENDEIYDVVKQFKMQIYYFPFGSFKDLVDSFSRIYDMEPKPPRLNEPSYIEPEYT
jgi:hypothetical protein